MAICSGSVSPSNSTITGAHILHIGKEITHLLSNYRWTYQYLDINMILQYAIIFFFYFIFKLHIQCLFYMVCYEISNVSTWWEFFQSRLEPVIEPATFSTADHHNYNCLWFCYTEIKPVDIIFLKFNFTTL